MTGVLDIAFLALKILMVAGVLYAIVRSGITISKSRNKDEEVPLLLWRYRIRMLLLLLLVLVVAVGLGIETAYRPKVAISQDNRELRKKLERVDNADLPPLKPVEQKPSWEEQQKKNRQENEDTRREFDKLPDRPRR